MTLIDYEKVLRADETVQVNETKMSRDLDLDLKR